MNGALDVFKVNVKVTTTTSKYVNLSSAFILDLEQVFARLAVYFWKVRAYCSLRRLRSHAHAQAHTQVSLRVQFIARAKS